MTNHAAAENRARIKRENTGMFFSAPRRCYGCKQLRSRDGGAYRPYGNRKNEWVCDECAGRAGRCGQSTPT